MRAKTQIESMKGGVKTAVGKRISPVKTDRLKKQKKKKKKTVGVSNPHHIAKPDSGRRNRAKRKTREQNKARKSKKVRPRLPREARRFLITHTKKSSAAVGGETKNKALRVSRKITKGERDSHTNPKKQKGWQGSARQKQQKSAKFPEMVRRDQKEEKKNEKLTIILFGGRVTNSRQDLGRRRNGGTATPIGR